MRVLCFPTPERGHLNPVIPTLRRLADSGHQVVVAAFADVQALLPPNISSRQMPLQAAPLLTRGEAFAKQLRDAAWLSSWIEAMLIDGVPVQLPPIAAMMAEVRPDIVIVDPMNYAAVIACLQAKVRWVALSSSLNPVTPLDWTTALTTTMARIDGRRHDLFVSRGLAPPAFRVADAISPWLTIAFTTEGYVGHVGRVGRCDHVHLVGAPFDDSDVETSSTLPLSNLTTAYVSFGSQAFHQPQLFSRVFACCQRRGWRVVASVGDLMDDRTFMATTPPHAMLFRYAPQLEILPDVDIVVTHGGANTVIESLWFGKPMVMLPLCNDQPLQARFALNAGVATVVEAHSGDVAAADLEDAVDAAMSCRAAAQAHAALLRQAGGPSRAAELVVALASS